MYAFYTEKTNRVNHSGSGRPFWRLSRSGDVPCLLSGCLKPVFCATGRQMPWFPEGKTRPFSAHAGPASAPRNPGKGEVCMRTAAAALPRNRSVSFAFRAAPVNGAEAPLFPADHDAEPFRLYRIRRCLPAGRACAFCIFAVYARRFRAFLLFFCTYSRICHFFLPCEMLECE